MLGLSVLEATADEALYRVESAFRVRLRLAASDVTNQPVSVVSEAHDRWCGPRSLVIGNDDRITVLDDGDARVGRAEIDPDGFR